MKRWLIAVLVYLVVSAGVAAGTFTKNPYKGNSIAIFEAAGVGLAWPVVMVDVLIDKVGGYYGNVGGG